MRVQFRDRARTARRYPTLAERKVWSWLRRRYTGHHFRRQHPVGEFILDFYCAALRLCIEIDGPVHELRVAYDRRRSEKLAKSGITVVRISDDYVRSDPDGAWLCIRDAIGDAERSL